MRILTQPRICQYERCNTMPVQRFRQPRKCVHGVSVYLLKSDPKPGSQVDIHEAQCRSQNPQNSKTRSLLSAETAQTAFRLHLCGSWQLSIKQQRLALVTSSMTTTGGLCDKPITVAKDKGDAESALGLQLSAPVVCTVVVSTLPILQQICNKSSQLSADLTYSCLCVSSQ